MGVSRFLASSAVLVLASSCLFQPLSAGETITYTYDALGRLVVAQRSGTVNNGQIQSLCYDPAGNRTVFKSDSGGAAASCQGGGGGTPTPTPAPSFAIGDAQGLEGQSLVFAVTRSGTSTGSWSVNFATANGSATTADYAAQSGTLVFGSGETVKYISIATYTDSYNEATETFVVNLSGASGGATITDAQGVGTLYNEDAGGCSPFCQ